MLSCDLKYYFCNTTTVALLALALLTAASPAAAQNGITGMDVFSVDSTTCGSLIALTAVLTDVNNEPIPDAIFEINIPPALTLDFDPTKTSSPLLISVVSPERVTVLEGFDPGDTKLRVLVEGFHVERTLESIAVFFRIDELFSSVLSLTASISGSTFATQEASHSIGVSCDTLPPPERLLAFKSWALAVDADGDSLADPGDQLTYTTRILVRGTAEAVVYDALPEDHMTLVAGSVTAGGNVLEGNDFGDTRVRAAFGTLTDRDVTVSYTVRIDSPVPPGVDQVECQGQVTGGNFPDLLTDDPTTSAVADPTVTPLDFDPLLGVDKRLLPGADPSPGGLLSWEVTVANSGLGAASDVVVFERVPAQTVFDANASDPAWSCPAMPTGGSTCTLSLGTVPAGAQRMAVFAVRLADPLPAGFEETENCVSVGETATPAEVAETCRSVSVPGGAPDLAVGKSDLGASVEPGQTVIYRITAENLGNRGATGVTLEEIVPEHTVFEPGASEPGWVCAGAGAAGDLCTLELGSLSGGGASKTASFAVTVDGALAAGVTQIVNTVTVTDDGTNGADTDPTNNTDTETTPLTGAMPELGVEKTLEEASDVRPGGLLVWSLTVTNTGNQEAAGVELSEEVPAHTRFAPGASDPAWSCTDVVAGSSCTLRVGNLAAGTSASATFAVTLAQSFPPGVDVVENCASVDELVEGCQIVPLPDVVPDLGVDKDDGGVTTTPGGTVSYTVSFANHGPQGATGVVLEDRLPEGTSLVPQASDPRWSCQPEGAAVLCRLEVGALAAGETGVVTLTVEVAPDLPAGIELLTNRVAIEDDGANGTDPDLSDNEATETTPVEAPQPPAPPALEVTLVDILAVDTDGNGGASEGDVLTYVARITNSGPGTATGMSFRVEPDPHTELTQDSVTTSQGVVLSGDSPLDAEVAVELGELAEGAGADVTFEVVIGPEVPAGVTELSVQGEATAEKADLEPSDDPDTPEDDDPTRTPLVTTQTPAEIPTVSELGLVLLVVLLAAGGIVFVRRRSGVPALGGAR